MKISKTKLKKIIAEAYHGTSTIGGVGIGFKSGKTNGFNPWARYLVEEEEKEESSLVDDAWAGGENLVKPTDYVQAQAGIETINEPSILSINESHLRNIIRKALMEADK